MGVYARIRFSAFSAFDYLFDMFGVRMQIFRSILVTKLASEKQTISGRVRGVPWEGSWGVPCGTRGFRGEPRYEAISLTLKLRLAAGGGRAYSNQ